MHDWIASTAGACQGALHPWTPPGVPAKPTTPAPAASPAAGRIVVTSGGRVRVFDARTHTLRRVISPFGTSFTGAMAIAVGDVNRDGVADYAAAGSGAVKILNGKSGGVLATYSIPAVSVALGDVTGDRRADLIVGTKSQVKVFDARTHALLETLSPFGPAYTGGDRRRRRRSRCRRKGRRGRRPGGGRERRRVQSGDEREARDAAAVRGRLLAGLDPRGGRCERRRQGRRDRRNRRRHDRR